jgi:hypothetical protein
MSAFDLYAKDMRRLLTETRIPLTYSKAVGEKLWADTNGFEVTTEKINFNGKDDDSHETFYIERVAREEFKQFDPDGLLFGFCKTAMKPYDTLVVAGLILAQFRFGKQAFRISSDGEVSDWQVGLKLVNDTFGLKLEVRSVAGGLEVINTAEMIKEGV